MYRLIAVLLLAVACALVWRPGARAWHAHQTTESAHQHITDTLKDPASVQWRGDMVSSDGDLICGTVNAKNSMGGYVGFKRYLASQTGYLVEDAGGAWPLTDKRILVPQDTIDSNTGFVADMRSLGSSVDQAPIEAAIFNAYWQLNCQWANNAK
jgi:hypothetical protein